MKIIDLFIADFLKLKSSLALYFSLFISLFLTGLIFLGHIIDVHSLAQLAENSWLLYFNRAETILTAFMIVPFTIFLVLSVHFIERKADSKKLLYTLPIQRHAFNLIKTLIILLLLGLILLTYIVYVSLSGYVLNLIFPEYELIYYSPPIFESLSLMWHTFVACLGILGIQILMHSYFKSYLLPLGIGFIAFLSGFILATMNLSMTKFHPFCYPIIIRDLNFIRSDFRELYFEGWFSNLELYSLIIFVICMLATLILERYRMIK